MGNWCDEPPPELLRRGIEQFNRREFFEQHETLEELWRAERRDVRYLYQGILQIGVAFHHLRRSNYHGVVYMLTRGSMYLSRVPGRCQGVDADGLRQAARLALDAVEALGAGRLHDFDPSLVPTVLIDPA
jgi:uncharacterized protein